MRETLGKLRELWPCPPTGAVQSPWPPLDAVPSLQSALRFPVGISGDNDCCTIAQSLVSRRDAHDRRLQPCRRLDMLVRSSDSADLISDTSQLEIFTLPIDAARCKAREIIHQFPQSGFIPIIENWRQRPDGQIEFAIRHLPASE